jgi:hypothetical protein
MKLEILFAWKGLKKAINDFVQSCLVCQQAKPDRSKLSGLLQPLSVPDGAWQVISLDFVEELPISGPANCVLVIVDKFTKYRHFVPLKHPYTTSVVAKALLDHVYRLHGLLTAIVSNRDNVFTSALWRELFAFADVQLRMSIAYHSHTDDQTERPNQCLETFLRYFISGCPKKWLSWLLLAEYNSRYHSPFQHSPFEALYGYAPRYFGLSPDVAYSVPSLDEWLKERQVISELIKQQLQLCIYAHETTS